MNLSLSSAPKRPISLQGFIDNLPTGAVQSPTKGRYVFGPRMQDTLPYLVEPGAEAVVKADEVASMPISVRAFAFTFDLSKPEHRLEYQSILDAAASGWYKILFTHRYWDTEKKDMYVYIEVLDRHRVIRPSNPDDRLLAGFHHSRKLTV